MLRLQAIGDGNCLYNTEAVLLIYAYQTGRLQPLLKNNEFKQNMGKVFSFLAQEIPSIILPAENYWTDEAVKTAFNSYLKVLERSNQPGNLDWILAQQSLAKALRAFVVDCIEHNPTCRKELINELKHVLREIRQITRQGSSQEIISFSAEHFKGMPAIIEKLDSICGDDTKTDRAKRTAINRWFFDEENPNSGINLYLRGSTGIANSGVEGEHFEYRVLAYTLHHVVKLYSSKFFNERNARYLLGFKPPSPTQIENLLIFEVERSGEHWNVFLPEEELAQAVVKVYEPQFKDYLEKKDLAQKLKDLKQALTEHGTLFNHSLTLFDNPEQYIAFYHLTAEQFKNNQLPDKLPTSAELLRSNHIITIKPLPSKKEEPPMRTRTQSKITFELSLAIFVLASTFIAMVMHCFVTPLFVPLMEALTGFSGIRGLAIPFIFLSSLAGGHWALNKIKQIAETPVPGPRTISPRSQALEDIERSKPTISSSAPAVLYSSRIAQDLEIGLKNRPSNSKTTETASGSQVRRQRSHSMPESPSNASATPSAPSSKPKISG